MLINAIIYLLTVVATVHCSYMSKLHFQKGKDFTILQFTDLHYGEGDMLDINTTLLIEKIINATDPDLVVVTGDAVAGYMWDGWNNTFFSQLWHAWTEPMRKLKRPYMYILGNHDVQADFSRSQICEIEKTHPYSLFYCNDDIIAPGNYFIPIFPSSNSLDPAAIMWAFDTHEYGCDGLSSTYGCVEPDQINWFNTTSRKIKDSLGYIPSGLAFFHVPLAEYRAMHNWGPSHGTRGEQISCPRKNTNFFQAMLQNKNIKATFCGHDHQNDNGGIFYDIELVYGRKTGYGCYGTRTKGGRVIKLKERHDITSNAMTFDYEHYIIEEDLTIVKNGIPTWKGGKDYVVMCGP